MAEKSTVMTLVLVSSNHQTIIAIGMWLIAAYSIQKGLHVPKLKENQIVWLKGVHLRAVESHHNHKSNKKGPTASSFVLQKYDKHIQVSNQKVSIHIIAI